VGWVPFDVQCTGSSSLDVVSWTWDFGDGDFAYEQSPIHTYEEAGLFDIELEVYDGSQTVSKYRPEYVIALADSLIALDADCKAGDTVEITIYARNNLPLTNLWVPLRWAGDFELSWVGYHTQGCRTDYFEDTARLAYSGSGHLAVLELRTCNDGSLPDLEPGAGPVVKVLLAADTLAEYGQTTPISVDALGYLPPKFFGDRLEYIACPVQGTVTCTGCCRLRGDVNGSASGPDISDLVYMIGYMFKEGPAPPCLTEADIDGSGGDIDVSDLVSLVNFMFKNGDPPEPCP
jgi:PKD repeat protein